MCFVFVCLFDCLFVCLLAGLFVYLIVCLFVCLFVCCCRRAVVVFLDGGTKGELGGPSFLCFGGGCI